MRGGLVLGDRGVLRDSSVIGWARHAALVLMLAGCVLAAPQPVAAPDPVLAPVSDPAPQLQPQPDPASQPLEPEIQGKNPPKSEAQRACESRGRLWARVHKGHSCVVKTRDSGKTCRSKADCQGQCLARSMTCAPALPMFGCHEVIERGGMRVTLCID